MHKQLTKSVCLVICLTMVISVSAYSADMARAEAMITVTSDASLSVKAKEKAELEKYNKEKPASCKAQGVQNKTYSELNREVSYAIIPDNPLS